MKRSDMRVGQKAAYRFPSGYGSTGRYPHYAEATILDLDWDHAAAGHQHEGVKVRGYGRILFDLPGYEYRYRAEHDGRQFTDWTKFVESSARGHLVRQKLHGDAFEAAVVSHVRFDSDGTERPGEWEAVCEAAGVAPLDDRYAGMSWVEEQMAKQAGR